MPHSTTEDEELEKQQREDDQEQDTINRFLGGEGLNELENFQSRELDLGEKADDAQDYEDIDDDDLADEDSTKQANGITGDVNNVNGEIAVSNEPDDFSGLFEENGQDNDPFDDLFNEREDSQLVTGQDTETISSTALEAFPDQPDVDQYPSFITSAVDDEPSPFEPGFTPPPAVAPEEESEEDEEYREQRKLFEQSRLAHENRERRGGQLEPPPAPETDAELFSTIWPQFEPDKPPRWSQLVTQKHAHYLGKTPLKPPKPLQPTKVNLELAPDQEKAFKLPGLAATDFATRQAEAEVSGVILTLEENAPQQEEEDDSDSTDFETLSDVGGLKWRDFVAVCQSWDIPSPPPTPPQDPARMQTAEDQEFDLLEEPDGDGPATKKQKLGGDQFKPLPVFHDTGMSWDDPEKATEKLARRVQLDLNDPHLLIDVQQPTPVQSCKRGHDGTFKRDEAGGFTRELHRRYNISNDDAYELLKENHQSKIRSTLGSMAIEHSLPAARLQYPYYKVKLNPREARSFHRPTMLPEAGRVFFDKPRFVKRKHLRHKGPKAVFAITEDLSQADNSNVLLLEYSEEYPPVLSSFGMGNRLINYYRRKDDGDSSRPKAEIGETAILMPQDKSPFSIFGYVDPGQTTPTIHNALFRAPVFKHESSPRDFMLITNRTGQTGRKWYLKNIENLHVVGQEFPLVEVPGTHSRKVTDTAKKRLRMLAFRMFKKHKRLKNDMIIKHLPGTDIAQNRSKMREFMNYDKDKGWLPRDSEPPDESTIRSWLKPEDVCLLESTQVGDRQLHDAGYNKEEDDMDDDDEEKDGQSLDQQLAPWQTTKNFLHACQGKAMLQLHGGGDPSGRGEAFNFIRTSMKGGFKEIGESVQDRLDSRRRQDLGGHSYNVAKQQRAYSDAIRRIWDAQRTSLSSTTEHDVDMDDAADEVGSPANSRGRTPSGAVGKPRRDDETTSVFSRTSTASQGGKVLRITRETFDDYGEPTVTQEIIRDSKVIREYLKRRRAEELSSLR